MRTAAKKNGLRFLKLTAGLCLALVGAGCATEALNQRGAAVEMTESVDKTCKNLGPVIGKGGGEFGGGWISDEDLIQYAMNDLRNKAGARGATHVIFNGHEMGFSSGEHGGTTSTATITGIAYWCPPDAPAAQPVVQGAPPAPAAVAAAPAPAAAPAGNGSLAALANAPTTPLSAPAPAPAATAPAAPAAAPAAGAQK